MNKKNTENIDIYVLILLGTPTFKITKAEKRLSIVFKQCSLVKIMLPDETKKISLKEILFNYAVLKTLLFAPPQKNYLIYVMLTTSSSEIYLRYKSVRHCLEPKQYVTYLLKLLL